jgi:hypothetical protein
MVIKKNTHAPFRFPRLFSLSKSKLECTVNFNSNCKYDIGEDQDDVNKLFGIGYFPFHRWNSIRFGWRYSKENDKIEILAYWYLNKVRNFKHICYVDLNREYDYSINLSKEEGKVYFSVSDLHSQSAFFEAVNINFQYRNFGYILKPYFGGNRKAPHDMNIKFKFL